MAVSSGFSTLVGREAESAVLREALRLTGSAAQVVEVVGEPGIGKTRLMAELAEQARQQGWRTVTGRATEFEQDVPFAPLVEALDDHAHRAGAAPADLRPLERVLLAGPGLDDSAVERFRSMRALRQALEELAAPSGLVLLLDDVHWADPSSVDLLEFLLRRPPVARILLAVAYRPAQVPARLAAALAAGQSTVHRLRLAPLREPDVAMLLGSGVGAARVRRLHRLSGGNPLYLEALRRADAGPAATPPAGSVDAVPVDGPETSAAVDTVELPPEVRAALLADLAAVGELDRAVAAAAAVCGYEIEPALLAAVAQLPPPATLRSIDALTSRDVLQPVAGTGQFRFRHPLVRQVVYASTPAGWRLGAHARAAAYLASVGAPPRVRAHHVARSASAGDTEAADTLVAAARAVGAQAPATAVAWLRAALRLLPATAPSEHGDLLMYLAGRQAAGGRLDDARATMGTVLDQLPAGHPRRADAVAWTATLLRLLGQTDEARLLLADELARLPERGAPDALHLCLQLATYAVMRGRLREAGELLHRVIEHGPGTAPARIAAALQQMTGYGTPGDAAPGQLIDTLADEDIARHIDLFAWLCWSALYLDGPHESLRRLHRCRRVAVAAGHGYVLPYLLSAQAFAQARLARIGAARHTAEEATTIARLLGADEPLALALLTECWLLRCAGAYEEAVAVGEQAVAAATSSRVWLATARAMLAFARIAAGDVAGGRDAMVTAGGGPQLPDLYPHNRLMACSVLAESAAARGLPAEAARWADLAEQVADPGRDVGRGLAALTRAYARAAAEPAAAAQQAATAASVLVDAELLMEAGRAWMLAAACHGRAGDLSTARRGIEQALAIYADDAAAGPRREALALRHELGLDGDSASGVELTAQEARIAELIAAGRSDVEIANQLFLSVRTVRTHVTEICEKVGGPDRATAASRLARILPPR
ncbi:regulatory LuxR family protein [Krasilnikovia cinnamomea]|uniref:Regulatory LuxR family protein n=1 Tax=Krasilnikovia cinnamomea TaxID=349313 RepID=A0A4Q7ZTI1_9ACTN|nr:LuxR family transcriptional regulator [Krasilnikovia cinnamomea]RZU54234.1 regulatory LuxR family protein [Krasilnikovia cinnamomea]